MHEKEATNSFDRVVGDIAWFLFWGIINTVCIWLKLFHGFKASKPTVSSNEFVNPVRVAFCENGAGYGGAAISLVAFLEKLPPDYKAYIYTGIGSEPYEQLGRVGVWRHMPAVNAISVASLKKLRLPFVSAVDNLFNLLPNALRYYFAFKRDQIQYVYLNNDASCNFAAAIAAKMAGRICVLHARGFNSDTKGNRWVLANLDYCIAVSCAVRDELLTLGLSPEKCTVIPEGLDLTLFYPRAASDAVRKELNLQDNEPVIILVGGLVDWKGQDILLDAAPMIFEKFPTAHILLVGGAYGKDREFAGMIAERAKAPELRGRVRLLGTREDVSDILTCGDVVVHASTKPEPFGRTFLEGMALGKAVIASNEGGPLDVISHEVDGLLIEPRNPQKLADAVNSLLSDELLATRLRKNGAQKAAFYSIENHAAAIVGILNMLAVPGMEKRGDLELIARASRMPAPLSSQSEYAADKTARPKLSAEEAQLKR